MWLAYVAILLGQNSTLQYNWSILEIPSDLAVRDTKDATLGLAVTKDGGRVLVVTTRGAMLREDDKLAEQWKVHFDIPRVMDLSLLDDDRAVLTTTTELIQISLRGGGIIKRVPSRLNCFAPLGSGYLVGAVDMGRKLGGLSHALISPDDGKILFDFGDEALFTDVTVADRDGTRFASGSLQVHAWIGDPYVRATRLLTRPGIDQDNVRRVCFDATGHFLAAGIGDCEVVVFDLFDPPVVFRQSPRYLGKFGRPRMGDPCVGMGFLDDKWLWFANGRDLYFYTWPDLKPAGVTGPPGVTGDFFVWRASTDGHRLVGVNVLGKLYYGRLRP